MFRLAILLGIVFNVVAHSYNEVHYANYQIFPQPYKVDRAEVELGAGTYLDGDLYVPVALRFGITDNFEAGLRTNIYNERKYFKNSHTTWDLGFMFRLTRSELAMVDIYFGHGNDAEGLLVGYQKSHGSGKSYMGIYQVKLGFLDGLAGPKELLFAEIGFYPTFYFSKKWAFKSSITYSTSPISKHIKDNSAFDIEPGISFYHTSFAEVYFRVTFGVSGSRQEKDGQFHLGIIHGF